MSFADLSRDLTGFVLAASCDSPRSVLVLASVCKLWRSLALPHYNSVRWAGLEAAQRACQLVCDGDDGPAVKGLLSVFVARRTLPQGSPVSEATSSNSATRQRAEEWFRAPCARDTDVGVRFPLHEKSVQVSAMTEAFEWWNSQPSAVDDLEFDLPIHVRGWNVVPHGDRQLGRLVCAYAMGREVAYGRWRDSKWPLERCAQWVDARLAELGTDISDCEVYTNGDYWALLPRGVDGREHMGSGGGSFFECAPTMQTGCVLLTRHAVMVFASADED
jgi:hypothetical protein